MAITLESIGQYGFFPVGGTIAEYTVESIRQLTSVGKGRKEIAQTLGLTVDTIERHAFKNNIPLNDDRAAGRPKKHKLSGKTTEEYRLLREHYSNAEIAEMWDVSEPTLKRWREVNGLTLRKRRAVNV